MNRIVMGLIRSTDCFLVMPMEVTDKVNAEIKI